MKTDETGIDKPVILLVDDSNVDAAILGLHLKQKGFHFERVESGEEAVKFIEERHTDVDLILMDMELGSGMDGAETAKVILEKHTLPILFLSGHTDEVILKRIEGISSYGYIVKGSSPSVIIASIRMAFKLKEVKKELADSHRIFSHAMDMLCIIGYDGYFKVINPSWSRILGWSHEELLAREVVSFIDASDVAQTLITNTERLAVQGNAAFEVKFLCKDGTFRYLSWNTFNYPDEQVIYGNVRDITEEIKNRNEKELIQKELFESEKMKAIGQLSAGVAHEFNNILAIIKVKLQMIPLEIGDKAPPGLYESFRDIEGTITRGSDIVKDLMTIAKPSKEEKKVVYLGDIIDTVVNVLSTELKHSHVYVSRKYNTSENIFVDPGHIHQVFLNMMINAIHALIERPSPTIEIHIRSDEHYVTIEFSDNGHGISEEDLNKIFIPFFTTKGASAKNKSAIKGTGLGLFVCRDLLIKNDASISVTSTYGEGTVFTIRFARISDKAR